MSVYNQRDRPLYQWDTPAERAKNPYILRWWTTAHDEVIRQAVRRRQWTWHLGITDELVAVTAPQKNEAWKQRDPLIRSSIRQDAWHKVLMNFAVARAHVAGLLDGLREPRVNNCLMCGKPFREDSLPYPLVLRLGGIDHLDFCAPCLSDIVLEGRGRHHVGRRGIIMYLRELSQILQRVPPQDFGTGMADLRSVTIEERLPLLKLLRKRPTLACVKTTFGSWLAALIAAGILAHGVRPTTRGTQCLARDGHVCLSLAEKTIDDLLLARGISHEREVPYPQGGHRADFVVNGIFIEYFGLAGDPAYDARTASKKEMCRRHGITLISLTPEDVISPDRLDRKLLRQLTAPSQALSGLPAQPLEEQ